MKYNFQYQSGARSFKPEFGRVINATDGGFERGYAAGYTEGETAGKAEVEAENAEILVDINTALVEKGAEAADSLSGVPEKIGSIEAGGGVTGDIPDGYIKIDPKWTSLYDLCNGRSSMVQHIKYSDTANITNFTAMCTGWHETGIVVPSWDTRKATTIQNMYLYSRGIVEIGEMNIPNVKDTRNTFTACSSLERISFVAGCIHVNISFTDCPRLSDASIQSIIDGLADLSGGTAQTLTLHSTVGAKLTDAQKASAAAKNWTLVY